MKRTCRIFQVLRAWTAAVAIVALAALNTYAFAQSVVVVVNGDPITNYDIEQRTKLIQLGGQKPPARQDVIEELINEKLKIQLLRRFNFEGIDKDVDNAFANMARRMRQTASQFSEQLGKSGVMPETLKSRMKADMIWSQVIRGRYQSSFQFAEKDIQERLANRKSESASVVGYEYTLRPILFVVPRGSAPAAVDARRKEAEELRTQFQNCEEGLPLARRLRYVAVRTPVVRNSAELHVALRDMLEKTEVGRLTAPEIGRAHV